MPQSDIAAAYSERAGVHVSDAELMDSVLDMMTEEQIANLPVASLGQSIGMGQAPNAPAYAEAMQSYLKNMFVKTAAVIQFLVTQRNPLGYLKKGTIAEYGGKIQTVVMDSMQPEQFRPDLIDGKDNPWAANFGKVYGGNFTYIEDIAQKNAMVDTSDTQFFQNAYQFNQFALGKLMQMINGAVTNEFNCQRFVLGEEIALGKMKTKFCATIQDVAVALKQLANEITMPTTISNAQGVQLGTSPRNVICLINNAYASQLDVNFYSNLIYQDLAQMVDTVHTVQIAGFPDIWNYVNGHTVTQADIDGGYLNARDWPVGSTLPPHALAAPNAPEATQILVGDTVPCIIMDENALMSIDALPLTAGALNVSLKRYVNYYIQKKTYHVYTPALNAIAIISPQSALKTFDQVNYQEWLQAGQPMDASQSNSGIGSSNIQMPVMSAQAVKDFRG